MIVIYTPKCFSWDLVSRKLILIRYSYFLITLYNFQTRVTKLPPAPTFLLFILFHLLLSLYRELILVSFKSDDISHNYSLRCRSLLIPASPPDSAAISMFSASLFFVSIIFAWWLLSFRLGFLHVNILININCVSIFFRYLYFDILSIFLFRYFVSVRATHLVFSLNRKT